MSADFTTSILGLVAASVATITDIRDGKIYNWLTLPLLLLGPLVHFSMRGFAGVIPSILGIAGMIVILVVLNLVVGRGFGGGDLKLMVGLAGVVGWPLAISLLLYTGISSFLVVLPVLFRDRALKSTFRRLATDLCLRASGSREHAVGQNSPMPRIRYAVCILGGMLLLLLRGPV